MFLLGTDLFNFEQGERLTMTDITAVANLALVLDNGDLVGLTVLKHLGGYLYASDERSTNLDFRAVRFGNEHGVESQGLAWLKLKLFNLELFAGMDKVLLSTSGNNCVHRQWAAQALALTGQT